jgi:hypothetical protein
MSAAKKWLQPLLWRLDAREILSLTLREERRLKMVDNGVVRIFGNEIKEVSGRWKKLFNTKPITYTPHQTVLECSGEGA